MVTFVTSVTLNKVLSNYGLFLNYFKYENPSFLVKGSISAEKDKYDKLVNNVNNELRCWRNKINRKEIHENENPKK